ncbi:hypothetical protein [Cryobacterium arcticum]|uniref:Uncharacterized protein n=1 Tax=Cryobacterium arcticum TaxID=670052 RepID=A0A1B1BPL1_9MICO|nr:hypothetical protein [Cryobacterium arcticum]ANP74534.1 hypothetical protein PA27867_3616 [Cryobacterium arcticum]
MARVLHPQPQVGIVTDRLGGIEFTDGVAEVDLSDKPILSAALVQHGYTVELTPDADGMFEVWLGDENSTVDPLPPLPDAVEGEPRVYEEFTLPKPRRTRKA